MRWLARAAMRSPARVLVAIALLIVASGALAFVLLSRASTVPSEAASMRSVNANSSELLKLARWGLDPRVNDTDADGLPDDWEIAHSVDGCPDPVVPDATRDCIGKGMTLAQDHEYGTNPQKISTAGDGIPDAYKITHGMDPLRNVADDDPFGDGLTDLQRYQHGARADRIDSECSGMTDAEKVRLSLDPSRASTGGSGVPDGWALHFGLDPRDPGIGAQRLDGDPDGLTVLEKAQLSFGALDLCARPGGAAPLFDLGLDPRKANSMGDGIPDSWKARYHLNLTDPSLAGKPSATPRYTIHQAFEAGICPDKADCDGDGLSNLDELAGWNVTVDGITWHVTSDPMRAITDGDTIPDVAKRDGVWTYEGKTYHFAPLDPRTADTAGSGVSDFLKITKYAGLLDPTKKDSDGDHMRDGEKVAYWDARAAADPSRADKLCALCAFDGVAPNIANPDVDHDGLLNGDEVHPPCKPVAPAAATCQPYPASDPANPDTGGSGLTDGWKARNARFDEAFGAWDLDASKSDSFAGLPGDAIGCPASAPCKDADRDLDADGLNNSLKMKLGIDPHDPDINHDGIPNGWEYFHGSLSGATFGPDDVDCRGFRWLPTPGAPSPLTPFAPSVADLPIATYDRTRFVNGTPLVEHVTWTFRDAWRLNAFPLQADSSGDGLSDLWKAYWDVQSDSVGHAFTIGAMEAARDSVAKGMTALEDCKRGTDPFAKDTDGGGLPDSVEVKLGLDPLDPKDDAATGDADGDGLSNADELNVYHTDPARIDTIGKGLLDGADVVLQLGDGRVPSWLASGVAYHVEPDGTYRFLGNFDISRDPASDCAHKPSCSGDPFPDAWKVFWGLDARAYHAASEPSAGGLTLWQKYAWDRPANWSEARDGVWWLGLDPTRAPTQRELRDLNANGLDDHTGEDPDVLPADASPANLLHVLLARDANAAAPATTPTTLTIVTAPTSLLKGEPFVVQGRLDPPTVLVPVLADIDNETYGVGFTGSDGTFEIDSTLSPEHSVVVPEGVSSLFGERPQTNITWSAQTGDLQPGARATLVVRSYGVLSHDGAISGAKWTSSELAIVSNATFSAPAAITERPQAGVHLVVRLTDGAGDPHEPASAQRLHLDVGDHDLAPSRVDGANATFEVVMPDAPTRGVLRYDGDNALGAGSRPVALNPVFDTTLTLEPLPPDSLLGGFVTVRGRLATGDGAGVENAPVDVALVGSMRVTTGTDGRFEAQLPLPFHAPLGSRDVVASFAGDASRSSSRASAGLVLRAAPRFMNVTASARFGADGAIHGMLLVGDAAPRDPLAEGAPVVRVTSDLLNATVTVAPNGTFRASLPRAATMQRGSFAFTLDYEGSLLVDAAHAEARLVVAAPSRLVLADATLVRGRAGSVHGTLMDISGDPIPDAAVRIELGGSLSADARTKNDGSFAAVIGVPPAFPNGPALVSATFEGSETLTAAATSANATIVKDIHVLSPRSSLARSGKSVALRVRADDGSAVAVRSVSVSIGGLSPQRLRVDDDGSFRVATPSTTLQGPTVTIRVQASATTTLPSLDANVTLFTEHGTNLTFVTTAVKERNVTATARLVRDDGAPVSSASVTLQVGDGAASVVTTDAVGTASWSLAAPTAAPWGPVLLTASFAGSAGLDGSEAVSTVELRDQPRIEASFDAPGVIRVSAWTSEGSPMPNARVVLRLGAASAPLVIETDARGTAEAHVGDVAAVDATLLPTATHEASGANAVAAKTVGEPLGVPVISPYVWLVTALTLLGTAWAILRFRARSTHEVVAALAGYDRAFTARDEHAAVALAAYGALHAALERSGLIASHASPREVGDALCSAFDASAEDVALVVEAFERARYSNEPMTGTDAADARAALARLRASVQGER